QPGSLWTDSWLSAKAAGENLAANGRAAVPVTWSTEPPPERCDAVVMRVPRQLHYFEYQLAQLAATLPAGTTVLAAGMDKHLSPNTAALLEKYLGPTTRHRGRSRARVFSASIQADTRPEINAYGNYYCEPLGLTLATAANVFSRDKLDMGSRFMLENLHKLAPAQRITDLACGNGVLGIAALRAGLSEALIACDESAMAVACARINISEHASDADATVVHGDGLLEVGASSDLILCNPPFHQQQTVDDETGKRLLEQAAARMPTGGRLCIVANRHLNYQQILRRRFGQVELFAENRKFRIWLAHSS
ncbi:MAG: class I SAM-dependent methyltransferase, partial [Halieaceae bacterium]